MEIWDSQGLHAGSHSGKWQSWNSNSGILAPDGVLLLITQPPIVTVEDWLQGKSQQLEHDGGVILHVIGFVLSGIFDSEFHAVFPVHSCIQQTLSWEL